MKSNIIAAAGARVAFMPGLMEAVKGAVRREDAQLLDKVHFVACKVSVSNINIDTCGSSHHLRWHEHTICKYNRKQQLQHSAVAVRREAAQLLDKVHFVACNVSVGNMIVT
jgi:intracellular sulfur oxidation DsrE/DsrF family protein